MWGYSNVSEQNLILLEFGHNRWPRKIFLKLLEGWGILLRPFKSFSLMQQQEEGPTPVPWSRNELIQSGSHSYQFLDLFGTPRRLQVVDCNNLIWVDSNPVMGNHITQKLAQPYPKRTFSGVEVQFMSPRYLENISEIFMFLDSTLLFTTISSM